MRIYFILGGAEHSLVNPSPNSKRQARKLQVVAEWEELNSADPSYIKPSYQQYLVFKLLERNEEFWAEIIKGRKRLNMPESGLTWEQDKILHYSSLVGRDVDEHEEMIDEYYSLKDRWKIRNNIQEKILAKLQLHPFVQEELLGLIESNYIAPMPMDPIGWGTSEYDEENDEIIDDPKLVEKPDSLRIYIGEKITKNKLLTYIEDYWDEMNEIIDKLPSPENYLVTERDMRIYELREEGLTYKQIANQIIKEHNIDDPDGSINQDSVKTAYRRVVEKIGSVAKKRNKELS